jgi:hypothetical protein
MEGEKKRGTGVEWRKERQSTRLFSGFYSSNFLEAAYDKNRLEYRSYVGETVSTSQFVFEAVAFLDSSVLRSCLCGLPCHHPPPVGGIS